MDRRTLLALAADLLAAPLAGEAQEPATVRSETGSPWLGGAEFLVALLLVAGVMFLLSAGILGLLSGRRGRRKLAKVVVALGAGLVCGAFWILLVDTVVKPAKPDAMQAPAVIAVGVLTALGAARLLSMPKRLSQVVGFSAMAIGFHSLALPIAALISLLVGGAQAGDLRTIALSVGGLLLGVFLVFVGDRRRRRRSRSRATI